MKARRLTLLDLIAGLADKPVPSDAVPRVEISSTVADSRLAETGCLFIALRGEHVDGHDYIAEAIASGAVSIIAERAPLGVDCTILHPEQWRLEGDQEGLSLPVCLIVSDSLAALQRAAAYWRRLLELGVIGITGSVGKTMSKEVVAAVVGQRYRTLKSEGNYNNEIGLPLSLLHLTADHERAVLEMPLSLLHLTADHERAVLEMGMYDLGEITQLVNIALPQTGVVTNVGPVHLERLGTIERIAQAKAELPEALPPAEEGGVAILNADDERVGAMASQTRARVFTYGLSPEADLWADQIESEGLEGIRFRFRYGQETIHAHVPMLGRHSVHTALCAASVGLVQGLAWDEIVTGLKEQSAQLRLMAVPGPQGSTILDDTYNASPTSSIAALNLLGELEGRRIAVLGDMYELGQHEKEGHDLVGRRARDVVDLLITIGALGAMIGEAALEAGMETASVHMVDTNAQAIDLIQDLIKPRPIGDKLLVKGSRGLEMEEIVSALQEGNAS